MRRAGLHLRIRDSTSGISQEVYGRMYVCIQPNQLLHRKRKFLRLESIPFGLAPSRSHQVSLMASRQPSARSNCARDQVVAISDESISEGGSARKLERAPSGFLNWLSQANRS